MSDVKSAIYSIEIMPYHIGIYLSSNQSRNENLKLLNFEFATNCIVCFSLS